MARKRGSVVDSLTLVEYPFQFEPQLKDKETTSYGKQNVIGHRLPNFTWVGVGDSTVSLDVFLLADLFGTVYQLNKLKDLLKPQEDIGAPHPLYLNIGSMYVGKKFVLLDVESEVLTFDYADTMAPMEIKVQLKFEEIPSNRKLSGAGARI